MFLIKFRSLTAVCAASALLGLVACNDDNPWSGQNGQGGIALSLEASPDYVVGDAAKSVKAAAGTRASDDLFTIPQPDEFSIRLEKTDGSYAKEWSSLESFRNEEGFPTGAYTITASYGAEDKEGFDAPWFVGSAQLSVLEDRETEVSIEAILSNSLVSVSYTDGFKNYFSAWRAEVHSAGYAYNSVPASETRPVFVAPGSVDVAVEVTDASNRTVKLQAAAFQALARHLYNVTIDVNNGQSGVAQLVISFDDTVEQENVYIDLTDELFTSPAPSLIADGFNDGATLELLEGVAAASPLKFQAMAGSGIAAATLNFESTTFTPAFGKSVDLIAAPAAVQEQIAALGITAAGFFKNPGIFAVLDVTALPAFLPSGRHTVSLVIKDKLGRLSDPVSLIFDSAESVLTFAADPVILGADRATVTVAYNGGDPSADLKFQVMNDFGSYEDVNIISAVKKAATRAFEVEEYQVTFSLPATTRTSVPVKAFFKGREAETFSLSFIVPEYEVTLDPMATKLRFRIDAESEEMRKAVINAVQLKLTGPNATAAKFSRNTSTGIITMTGLTPASDYSLVLAVGSSEKDCGSFTTEADANVPNGDFSAANQRLQVSSVQVGGQYAVNAPPFNRDYTITSSIDRAIPDGWATLNDLTCYSGSSNKNTWFMVPSTYVDNGQSVIRSVGYHHNGETPAKSGGNYSTTYYCTNAPSVLNRSVGELFLGSYAFNGTADRIDGIAFSSRPASVSFDYAFAPYGDEQALVQISVLDNAGNVIASNNALLSSSSMTSYTISLPDYDFGKRAASLRLSFRSSASDEPGIDIPTGSRLDENQSMGNKTKGANNYKAFAAGSVLTVDNVKLNY